MKKLICGTSFLMLSIFTGCKDYSHEQHARRNKQQVKIIAEEEHSAPRVVEDVSAKFKASEGDMTCSTDSDCVPIPVDFDNNNKLGCFPCAEDVEQVAVNKDAARRIMASKKDECMEKMRNAQKGERPQRNKHDICKHNGAKCINGICELATLTEEELKEMFPQQQGRRQRHTQAPTVTEPNGNFSEFDERDGPFANQERTRSINPFGTKRPTHGFGSFGTYKGQTPFETSRQYNKHPLSGPYAEEKVFDPSNITSAYGARSSLHSRRPF